MIFAYVVMRFISAETVEVIYPKTHHIRHFIYASGSVEPVKSYKIASNAGGYIKKILVDINDTVANEQVVVEMDSQVTYKKLEQSKAKLDHATKKYESQKTLQAKGIVSEIAFSQALSEYDQAKAEYEVLLSNYADQSIKAITDCKMLDKYKEEGDYVVPGEPILLCGNSKPIRVIAKVDEDYIMYLKEGQKALVMPEANSNAIVEAKVTKILPYAEKADKSYVLYIDLQDTISLPLGLSVRANILAREKEDGLVVPTTAVFNGKVQILSGGTVQERRVSIGVKNYDYVEIIDGVSEQEMVLKTYESSVVDNAYYKGKLVQY